MNPELVLDLLAVFGEAEGDALAALAGCAPTDVRAALAAAAEVRAGAAGRYALSPGASAERLARLEADDVGRFRELHERALAYLTPQLAAQDEAAEERLVAVFERLANRVLDDAPALVALAARLEAWPLRSPAGRQRRRYFQALALAKSDRPGEAVAAFDALLDDEALETPIRGRALNSRANCLLILARPEDAARDYAASLALWQALGNRLREGLARLNLGILRYELQDYAAAEASLQAAIGCFEASGAAQWLAPAHNELGLVYRDLARWPEALDRLQTALAYYQAQGQRDNAARVANNIGEVQLFQGEAAQAREAFSQALAGMQTRTFAVDAYLNLGLAHQLAGDLGAAEAAYRAALDLARAVERPDMLGHAHFRLGDALLRGGRNQAAGEHLLAAATAIEAIHTPVGDPGIKISLLGRWQQIYEALILYSVAHGQPEAAFEWAERARARAFADAVARQPGPAGGPAAMPPAAVATAAEIQAKLGPGQVVMSYFTTGVLEGHAPWAAALAAGSPLRAHTLTPARTLLFVLTRATFRVQDCGLDPNVLASNPPRRADGSRYLRPAVLNRLSRDLLGGAPEAAACQTVIFIPHGPLHAVPFAALADARGQPLLRAGGPRLLLAPSCSLLARLETDLDQAGRLATPPRMVAVGCDSGPAGGRLRHTETEAHQVAAVTGGEALAGPEAKKERLRALAADCSGLHFACHGRFDHGAPLESFLQTGAAERLTAGEILREWRLRAALVVLSACQTGASRVLRGDEPMGLIRAFLTAGARSVLVSQWPVEDLPAFLLMLRFYQGLLAAPAPDAPGALREAQTWLRALSAEDVRRALATWGVQSQRDALQLNAPTSAEPGAPPDERPYAHPRHWGGYALVV